LRSWTSASLRSKRVQPGTVSHRKIADMMGHANVVTFQRIYRHLLRPVITDTSDLMDGIWGD
jgi:integrase